MFNFSYGVKALSKFLKNPKLYFEIKFKNCVCHLEVVHIRYSCANRARTINR